MAAKITQPWRVSPTILPKVYVRANGMTNIANISSKFVNGEGFSYGCAEFTLK